MTTRKDIARDILHEAVKGLLVTYWLKETEANREELEDALLEGLETFLLTRGIDPDVDMHGNRW